MRIERVTAHAFGPLRGHTLELAQGLTVIIGPNEAGKTTWHAAIRAALCGVRRSRGRATGADVAFEQRHRPWDAPERWEVEARLSLDDGRTIEITQDLAGKVACRAVDVVLGRDVSDEIMDGTPDASRWLGLDRDAFAATVCVNQAQILAIAGDATAAGLQEHMQRAASTRGTDATAAQARVRITAFRREHVGVDRVGARGPLRAAKERLERVESALQTARLRHDEYLEASALAEAAGRAAELAEERVRMVEAAGAAVAADQAARRAARAAELATRHPSRPPDATEREAEAAAVASALDAWASRPRPRPLRGQTSGDLERALAALPAQPVGDTTPHPDVIRARRRLEVTVESARISGPRPGSEPASDAADARAGQGDTPRGPVAGWALAAVAAIGGFAAVIVGQPVAGLGLLLAAAAAGAWTWWRAAADAAAARITRMEAELAAGRRQAEAIEWERRAAEAERARHEAEAALRDALLARGLDPTHDPAADAARYEAACRGRAEQAGLAGRRPALAQALDARRAAERAYAEQMEAAARAEAALREAASRVGIGRPADAPEALVERLQSWRAERSGELRLRDQALAEWQELHAVLDGRSLEELHEAAHRLAARADEAHVAAGRADLSSLLGRTDLDRLLELEREERDEARRRADGLAGGLKQMRREMPDVAEAEEALADARAELGRVARLATVLDETLRLLGAAEERVHRDLAPILADGVRRWLPEVTAGAYVDASVDPADLAIKVKEAGSGRWRPALLLSQGTREQVYLLLRTAMAQSLVTTGEAAPLLLDEVTAQADARRTEQLLIALHAIARERQVVLFTHDERVAAWAERTLEEPRDRLVRLARAAEPRPATGAEAVASA